MSSQLGQGSAACVWCGGSPCTSGSDSLCESYGYLHRGQGPEFQKVAAPEHHVAQCFHAPAPTLNTQCLAKRKDGCNSIRATWWWGRRSAHAQDPKQCLSSLSTAVRGP